MASPFQQKSLQRKLIYIVLMLVLFTASYAFRQYAVVAQAEELSLREHNIGEVELSGAAVRKSLLGLRGVVMCALWSTAMEKQKKNQWNELELVVRSLVKLQPHFITPWLFQSWNLAYNVSVESDRESDQYFYISRGIELLAEGERMNRHHPDLRFSIGFYNQNKIGQSDKTNVMRCLYQMSCIPANERDPARFLKDDGAGQTTIDLDQLEDFCKQHPQLVRRLRERLDLKKPAQMVQFLDENYTLPSIYEEAKKAPAGGWQKLEPKPLPEVDRFPVLPPRREVSPPQHIYDANEITEDQTFRLVDDFSAFACARAWFGYAQEPLPPSGEFPGQDADITDRTKQRRPKFTTAIFRNYPPRAQSYVAEELEKEGWFDEDGWLITDWFRREGGRGGTTDQFANGDKPEVGKSDWGVAAWSRAKEMWEQHGIRDKLHLTERERNSKERQAQFYQREYQVEKGLPPRSLDSAVEDRRSEADQKLMQESFNAYKYLFLLEHYLNLTNFKNLYLRPQVEQEEKTVAARKAFFEARRLAHAGDRPGALTLYEAAHALRGGVTIQGTIYAGGQMIPPEVLAKATDEQKERVLIAFAYWRELLRTEAFGVDSGIEDESYLFQVRYLRLIHDMQDKDLKLAQAVQAFLGESASVAAPTWLTVDQLCRPLLMPQPEIAGPFDAETIHGRPMISQPTRNSVNTRLGIGIPRSTEPPGPMPPPIPPAPPGPGQ
jgi:hypothetical protein